LGRIHPSHQNLAEYTGALVGVLGLVSLGIECGNTQVKGDSVAALKWAWMKRARGARVTKAAIVFTSACLRYGMAVKDATHISGERNFHRDKLPRLTESDLDARAMVGDVGLSDCAVIDLTRQAGFAHNKRWDGIR
jgi:hypothetical protein